jgi:spermidine synthase
VSPATGAIAASPTQPLVRSTLRLGLFVALISGLTSLAYQTLWTRLLASGTGNSTYVFTMILALFLIGIALGAITFNIIRTRIKNTIGLLAVAQLVVAILVIVGGVWILPGASNGILDVNASPGALFGAFLRTSALVVLPATFVMGLSFPAASALVVGDDDDVGGRSGLLLATNTLGAIIGTFIVPFAVIPLIGSPSALALIARGQRRDRRRRCRHRRRPVRGGGRRRLFRGSVDGPDRARGWHDRQVGRG